MIEREHYSLKEAAKLLSCQESEIIHLGAIGKIVIHAYVADLLVEPYKMANDIPDFPSSPPLRRIMFSGYVRIAQKDALRYDANPRSTVIRAVWLPSIEEQTYCAFLLKYRPGTNDLFMADHTSKRMADMNLVIKAEELIKAKEIFRPTKSFMPYLKAKQLLRARFPDVTDKEVALWLAYGDEGITAKASEDAKARDIVFRHEIGFADIGNNRNRTNPQTLADLLNPLYFAEEELKTANPQRWRPYEWLKKWAESQGVEEESLLAIIKPYLESCEYPISDPTPGNTKQGENPKEKARRMMYRTDWITSIEESKFPDNGPRKGDARSDAEEDSQKTALLRCFEEHLRSKANADNAGAVESRLRRDYANLINELLTNLESDWHSCPPAHVRKSPGRHSFREFEDHLRYEVKKYDLEGKGSRDRLDIAGNVLEEWEKLKYQAHLTEKVKNQRAEVLAELVSQSELDMRDVLFVLGCYHPEDIGAWGLSAYYLIDEDGIKAKFAPSNTRLKFFCTPAAFIEWCKDEEDKRDKYSLKLYSVVVSDFVQMLQQADAVEVSHSKPLEDCATGSQGEGAEVGELHRMDFVRKETAVDNPAQHENMDNLRSSIKSDLARKAVNARHDKPGGSRDKKSQIQAIWATGNFASRDICAEQECAALGMSLSSARKALINTPEPIKSKPQ